MTRSLYEEKPWVEHYLDGVMPDYEIPVTSVNDAFDEASVKWENRTALIFYGKKISYKSLRDHVDRFATALCDIGIKKGDRVAFLLLNSPEHVIAFFGAVKAGAIVTPVSPIYVSSEIKHQLQDCRAETIVCQDMLYGAVEKTGIALKNVILTNISEYLPAIKRTLGKSILREVYQNVKPPDPSIFERKGFYRFKDLIKNYAPDPPQLEIDPREDIVTLPYTGGTTGLPKGVMITHYNIIADLMQLHAFHPFLEEGKEVQVGYMPFYHASGQVGSIMDGILYGYTVVVITTPDLDNVLNAVMRYGASTFVGAPSMYEALKDYEKTDKVKWHKLKLTMTGADALHESTEKQWKARTGIGLHEIYGMTELTLMSHGTPLNKGKVGSIGIPVPNTMAAILEPETDEFVPIGEIGEIVVAGPQVCKGYWDNPDATKECEAMMDGVRWWRTGDLGSMGEDGYFYIYDRKRDLIKYKGLRVFAREVEEVLKTHSKISEVGVIGEPDVKVGENVKAVIVLEADARGDLSEKDIIEYCQGKLTSYKIPKLIEFVGEIPKTDVGKVSRRELRDEEV